MLSNEQYSLWKRECVRKLKDYENSIEAAKKIMDEKDEEIQRLEEQINNMKLQYTRISKASLKPRGDIKMEGNESLPMCGTGGSDCSIV